MCVSVLRSRHGFRPMCGCVYRSGVVTSQFCDTVKLEFFSVSGGGGFASETEILGLQPVFYLEILK